MSNNPNQPSTPAEEAVKTEWDELSQAEFTPDVSDNQPETDAGNQPAQPTAEDYLGSAAGATETPNEYLGTAAGEPQDDVAQEYLGDAKPQAESDPLADAYVDSLPAAQPAETPAESVEIEEFKEELMGKGAEAPEATQATPEATVETTETVLEVSMTPEAAPEAEAGQEYSM